MSVARYIGGLSKSELETVGLVCQGLGSKEVAWKLNISYAAIKWRLTQIYRRLGISSRYELVAWAYREGLMKANHPEAELSLVIDDAKRAWHEARSHYEVT